MNIKKVVSCLELIAPQNLAEPFDIGKIGIILNRNNDIDKIAVALDPTDYVLTSAVELGADMLITHHPLIFNPVNKITYELSNTLKIAIENNISIYTMHTNFDKAYGGINDALAEVLGLKNLRYDLQIGRIGYIKPCFPLEFEKHVCKSLGSVMLHTTGEVDGGIAKVMVVGGNGFTVDNIDLAKSNGVDAFVSGEMNYHTFRYAENNEDMILIAATHYATEVPGMKNLVKVLETRLDTKVYFIEDPPKVRNNIRNIL